MLTGRVDIVGFGPGSKQKMTFEAYEAIENSDLIIGYGTYTGLIKEIFRDKDIKSSGMGEETERCRMALDEARKGKRVSLICSGDSMLYGMAALVYELCPDEDVRINTIAGVTAALSCGALLGAPLTDDFATVSLSDHITPFEKTEKRLRCLARADMLIVLYNPASRQRPDHLKNAVNILLDELPRERACGIVQNAGREGEISRVMTLKELKDHPADMFTTVFIGNSKSYIQNGKLITKRGYRIG